MPSDRLVHGIADQLADLDRKGLTKRERQLQGPQGSAIRVQDRDVVNFCANNYLGLANHPAIVAAAHDGLDRYGYGMASVRFICGTQDIHKKLEAGVSRFLGKDDAILYSSCWDANGGLFETILTDEDAILSDELNHASIIDGVRLCKAKRYRYKNCDVADLERQLKDAASSRFRLIATDGVFSMDGSLSPLPDICDLADRYDAIVMVDDSHATGILGKNGKGTPEELGVLDRIDILTSTLGKTLGGGTGGFTCARKEIVELLRQRSRPYLFSNALPPPIVMAADCRPDLDRRERRPPRPAARQCQADACRAGIRGLHAEAGPTSDLAGDARRSRPGRDDGRSTAPARDLRHRLQLPGGAAGAGADPVATLRSAHAGPVEEGDRGFHGSRPGAQGDMKSIRGR